MAIPNELFYDPRPRFADVNNKPLTSGRVQFFDAGTTVLKAIYEDSTETTPMTNPVILDGGGYVPTGGVWVPEGDYKISVESFSHFDGFGVPVYSVEWTLDNITGAGGVSGSNSLGWVETIGDLRAVEPDSSGLMYVKSYYTSPQGIGGGMFYWDTNATDVDDGGSIIAPDGTPSTGRWYRIFTNSTVEMQQWGVRSGSAYSNASNVENMILFLQGQTGFKANLNMPDVYLNGNVAFVGDYEVTIREGCRFRGLTGTHTLNFDCSTLVIESRTELAELADNLLKLEIDTIIDVMPQWWGAVEDLVTDSQPYFFACAYNTNVDSLIIIDAPFYIQQELGLENRTIVKKDLGHLKLEGNNNFTVDGIISDGNLFSGDFFKLIMLRPELDGDWFDFDGVIDNSKWMGWVNSLLSNGPKLVNWNSGSYEFDTVLTEANEHIYELRFNIASGVLFKTSADVFFPIIVSENHCIDVTQTGRFLFNQEIDVQWFGAYYDNTGVNASAFTQAIASDGVINGNGKKYLIDSELANDTTHDMRLKNVTLVLNSGFTSAGAITTSGHLYMDNVTIDINGQFPKRAITIGSTALYLAEIDSCHLGYGEVLVSGTGMRIAITNTKEFFVNVNNSQKTFLIRGCRLSTIYALTPSTMMMQNNTF